MQTLVYENYNKFIAATETIRSVLQNYFILFFGSEVSELPVYYINEENYVTVLS